MPIIPEKTLSLSIKPWISTAFFKIYFLAFFFPFSSFSSSTFSTSFASGFISGNITTSLRLSCWVRIANILSNHIPNPDCGGMPYSIAMTNSSSPAVASSSPLAEASACLSKFSCCNNGSTNSEYALHISRPLTMSWNCSTIFGLASDVLASGCMMTG